MPESLIKDISLHKGVTLEKPFQWHPVLFTEFSAEYLYLTRSILADESGLHSAGLQSAARGFPWSVQMLAVVAGSCCGWEQANACLSSLKAAWARPDKMFPTLSAHP
jgi:hypothetical protein